MVRVSARAPQRLSNDELEVHAVALIKREGPVYSIDLARATGVRYNRAVGALKRLEAKGVLKSWHEPSPRSGLGRRYYELVNEEASDD